MQMYVVPSSLFADLEPKIKLNVLSSAIESAFCPICDSYFKTEASRSAMSQLADACCGYCGGWRECSHYREEDNAFFVRIIDNDWYWANVSKLNEAHLHTEWLKLARSSDYIPFWGDSTFITKTGDVVVRCNSNSAAPCYLGLRFNFETMTKLRKLYYSSPDSDKMLIEFAPDWKLKKIPLLEPV